MRPALTTLYDKPFLVNADDACLSSWLLRGDKCDAVEIALACSVIRPGDTVVDIGANIGFYTVLLADFVGPFGHVYAFEPEPANFALLQENIGLRGLENVTAERLALFSRPGEMSLFSGGVNCGAHSLVHRTSDTSWVVPVTTYDDYFGPKGCGASFIKIDAEGAEADILAGASSIFDPANATPKAILLELNSIMQNKSERSIGTTLLNLARVGFVFSVIAQGGPRYFDSSEITRVVREFAGQYVNLWCQR